MDSDARSKHSSPNFTRLESVDNATRKRIESEEGVTALKGTGLTDAKAKMSRRGSIMILKKNDDGKHTIDILHSARTAKQLTPDTSSHLKSERQKKKDESTYHPPEYKGALHGHVAQVKRFEWTSAKGFKQVDDHYYKSGKADGDFGPATMTALGDLHWPNLGESEKSHHSEAEYAAKNYGPSVKSQKQPSRGGLLVHQIKGFNDMCRNCQDGISGSVAKSDSGHIVTYTGKDPFNSTGDWNAHKGSVMAEPGTIFRSRPESMLSGSDKGDHMERAEEIRKLRGGSSSVKTSLSPPPASKKRPRNESIDSVVAKPKTKPSFKPVAPAKATPKKRSFNALAEKPKPNPVKTKASGVLSPPPAKRAKHKEGDASGTSWKRPPGGRLERH